jgi:hypothetical protein
MCVPPATQPVPHRLFCFLSSYSDSSAPLHSCAFKPGIEHAKVPLVGWWKRVERPGITVICNPRYAVSTRKVGRCDMSGIGSSGRDDQVWSRMSRAAEMAWTAQSTRASGIARRPVVTATAALRTPRSLMPGRRCSACCTRSYKAALVRSITTQAGSIRSRDASPLFAVAQ